MRYEIINTDTITAGIQVRKLSPEGIRRLKTSIQERGYLPRYPLAVALIDSTGEYKLLDGHHRLEALRQLGQTQVPAQVFDGLTADEEYRLAYESNRGQDAIVPQDWTDDAEFIWSLAAQGKTQPQIGEIMRWSREAVKNYVSLKSIASDAWQIIVGTIKAENVPAEDMPVVPANGTAVPKPFTENLLRSIISLTAAQQIELVKELVGKKIDKAKFKTTAERYHAQNDLMVEAERLLTGLPEEYLHQAIEEIQKGHYDKEYLTAKSPGILFMKLIKSIKDKHDKERNYTLEQGDFRDLAKSIPDNSIELIFTDPPYDENSIPLYEDLAQIAARVLVPGGSLICYAGHYAIPSIIPLMQNHLRYWWILACKHTGPSARLPGKWVMVEWKPMLWFVKDGRRDNEYVADAINSIPDKKYHEWGQGLIDAQYYIEHLTKPGETVFDPMVGGGTTALAALMLGRHIIAFDKIQDNIEITRQRINEYSQGT